MKTTFLRVDQVADKEAGLRLAIRKDGEVAELERLRYSVDPSTFRAIPRAPFTYWLSGRVLGLFSRLAPFEADGRTVRVGLQTSDDLRFLRLAWEVERRQASDHWCPIVKGGKYSPFYAGVRLVVNWRSTGHEIASFPASVLRNEVFYHRPGLTWPVRAIGLSPSPVPRGCIFSVRGYLATGPEGSLLWLLALMGSKPFEALFRAGLSGVRPEFVVGVLVGTPVPDLTPADEAALALLARRAWSLKRSLDTRTETSHAFVLPALLQTEGRTLAARSAAWTEHVQSVDAELAAIQAEIDERCFTLYGIDDEDRRAITEGFGGSGPDAEAAEDTDAEDEAEAEEEAAADTRTLAAELVSWAVGVACGRFDVRLATGARELAAEPGPFDPLPVCSPAMLTGDDGLPLSRPPAGYPLSFPEDGIVVDDEGHPRDLVAAVRSVFWVVFGPAADAVWQEAAALLDPKGHDLRTWLASGFFGHHLQRHSKSRRKAPILWQLGPASARYSTWLYAHRLTRDSLFALARDVVAPKLALEERRQTSLIQEGGPSSTAKQRAEIAAQDAVVAELRVFADEVRRVAPLWNPDLDDGIVLVEAPLWRLVPHKPWAKELKSRWDDLVAGKYDWAHTAMHLWPERVVPKCATDRSLAIAHGLEDVFWAEGADGKWTKRARPTRLVEELVAERTSPAVKAALAELGRKGE